LDWFSWSKSSVKKKELYIIKKKAGKKFFVKKKGKKKEGNCKTGVFYILKLIDGNV
jgi:hypothetical protein